jgi:hypothetical protein
MRNHHVNYQLFLDMFYLLSPTDKQNLLMVLLSVILFITEMSTVQLPLLELPGVQLSHEENR